MQENLFQINSCQKNSDGVLKIYKKTLEPVTRRGGARGLAGFDALADAVTSAVSNVTNLMQSSAQNRDNQRAASSADDVLHRITMLQEQREVVNGDTDEERKTKRLKLIDSALDNAFAKLV